MGFTSGLLVLAAFALVFGLLALGSHCRKSRRTNPCRAPAQAASFWSNRVLWLCALALFFYLPLEATMAAWFTTYLGDNGVKEGTASALLSAFWLAFVVSRLTVAFNVLQLPPESEATVILVASLAGAAILTGVVLGHGARLAGVLVIVAGLVVRTDFPHVDGRSSVALRAGRARAGGRALLCPGRTRLDYHSRADWGLRSPYECPAGVQHRRGARPSAWLPLPSF